MVNVLGLCSLYENIDTCALYGSIYVKLVSVTSTNYRSSGALRSHVPNEVGLIGGAAVARRTLQNTTYQTPPCIPRLHNINSKIFYQLKTSGR